VRMLSLVLKEEKQSFCGRVRLRALSRKDRPVNHSVADGGKGQFSVTLKGYTAGIQLGISDCWASSDSSGVGKRSWKPDLVC